MFSLNPMKELYESPLPPMALTDYEAFSKFLNQALHCCHETGRDFNVYLDWAIRALASSMAADSAARMIWERTPPPRSRESCPSSSMTQTTSCWRTPASRPQRRPFR